MTVASSYQKALEELRINNIPNIIGNYTDVLINKAKLTKGNIIYNYIKEVSIIEDFHKKFNNFLSDIINILELKYNDNESIKSLLYVNSILSLSQIIYNKYYGDVNILKLDEFAYEYIKNNDIKLEDNFKQKISQYTGMVSLNSTPQEIKSLLNEFNKEMKQEEEYADELLMNVLNDMKTT